MYSQNKCIGGASLIVTVITDNRGSNGKGIYGVRNCVRLAFMDSVSNTGNFNRAVHNADNYSLFALAMYLAGNDWSRDLMATARQP